jgi:hypothetical protein
MKLIRHGAKGAEKPALLDADGQLRDLSKVLPDITAATLSPTSLQRSTPCRWWLQRGAWRRRGAACRSSSASA